MSTANDQYSEQGTATVGGTADNSYTSNDNGPVAVLKDDAPLEQPNDTLNPDSDEMLGTYEYFPSSTECGCTILVEFIDGWQAETIFSRARRS